MPSYESPDYADRSGLLTPFGEKLERLIDELIDAKGLRVLSVSHRIKSHTSAAKKIHGSAGKYGSFRDLHDFLGLRVITYLASDVDRVVALLRENFEVDESRSLDKQTGLDPDRFGYLSFHLVSKLGATRTSLGEWAAYEGVYFEIQIRSILQHAWAEIEHDLGYKSTSGVPAHIRRRFARLAGLLELADSEFDEVSGEVSTHVANVSSVIASGGDLAIDRDSISALVSAEGPVARADRAIAAEVGARVDAEILRRTADARADELIDIGYSTVDEVADAIQDDFDALVAFAVSWFKTPDPVASDEDDNWDDDRDEDGRYKVLSPGISLFYHYLHRKLDEPSGEEDLANVRYLDIPEVLAEFRRIHDEAYKSTPS